MTQPIIQIRHLTKTYGDGPEEVRALEDISLDIFPGEIFGIIGLSGAGKSTLVRCMNLLERPSAGSVLVDGRDMTGLSQRELREARRKTTMIFQNFNLLMQRSCLKNVCFPMELCGITPAKAKERALELLESLVGRASVEKLIAEVAGGKITLAEYPRDKVFLPALRRRVNEEIEKFC